jgi:hypothetical protein
MMPMMFYFASRSNILSVVIKKFKMFKWVAMVICIRIYILFHTLYCNMAPDKPMNRRSLNTPTLNTGPPTPTLNTGQIGRAHV